MIINAIYEFYADLRKSLSWWKILIFILASLILISLNVAFEETENFNTSKIYFIYFTVWICNVIRPKVSKLNYLLPSDKTSRAIYLIGAGSGSILLVAIWYGVIYFIGILMGTYTIENVLRIFFCEDLLIVIMISVTIMGTSYTNVTTNKIKSDKNSRKKIKIKITKANILESIIIILCSVFPVISCVFSRYFTGGWLIFVAIFAYISITPLFFFIIREMKKLDTCYENIRKSIKLQI